MNFGELKLDEAVFKKHGILLAIVFGSTITGRMHPGSDIDIGVLFPRKMFSGKDPAEIYNDLLTEFAKHFKDTKLDIVYLNEAPLSLQFKAINDGFVLYESFLTDFADYKEKIMNYYFDFRFFEDIFNQPYKLGVKI